MFTINHPWARWDAAKAKIWKKKVAPRGIEPQTLSVGSQRSNHCARTVLLHIEKNRKFHHRYWSNQLRNQAQNYPAPFCTHCLSILIILSDFALPFVRYTQIWATRYNILAIIELFNTPETLTRSGPKSNQVILAP